MKAVAVILATVIGAALTPVAHAGPPYITDDPEPTDHDHWEDYAFIGVSHVPGETAGAFGIDLNYGAAEDLQLTMTIPLSFTTGTVSSRGLGDIELAAKYRFAHQDGPLGLDIAAFPRVFLPTGYDRHGDRGASLLLPLWAQRDFGDWSIFGGGGYTINPGHGTRDFWSGGLAVTRQIDDRLNLGLELYYQGADTTDAVALTGLNIGAIYRLTDNLALLASGGPGIRNARQAGQYDVYLALLTTF